MQNLTGIVLCGGKSSRMGTDKAFITYYQLPQYQHVYNLLKQICNEVYISCNKYQMEKLDANFKTLMDVEEFGENGPIVGLLTAFKHLKNTSFFVVACDYPWLTEKDLEKLANCRNQNSEAICFNNPKTNFKEPLIAIYEQSLEPKLTTYFNAGNTSLSKFLNTVNLVLVEPNDRKHIESVDTPHSK